MAQFLPQAKLNIRTTAVPNFTNYVANEARPRPSNQGMLRITNSPFTNHLTPGQTDHMSGYGTRNETYEGLNNLHSYFGKTGEILVFNQTNPSDMVPIEVTL